jgi:tRNA threonylcarbamoyladenosine biosynthesis protein TsaE
MNPSSVFLPDQTATEAFGAALAVCAVPGVTIYLDGDLGAGKTTLVRGMLRALGELGPVKSPTYTLVELHAISGLDLYHFDFYRFDQPEEYLDAGLDEYFNGKAVCLVEWPARAVPYLPPPDLRIGLSIRDDGRNVVVESCSERGRQCLTSFVLPVARFSGSPPPV